MFTRFFDFSLRSSSVNLDERCWYAHFKVDGDVSHLFPFFQSVADEVLLYESPEVLQFKLNDIRCAVYPPNIVAASRFYGREQAEDFAQGLIELLNDLESRKSHLRPIHRKLTRLQVPDILRFLPMSDCGRCGFKTCMAFAGALSRRRTKLIMCPDFPDPVDVKIIFSTDDPNSRLFREIAIDSELAGFAVSRGQATQPNPVPQTRGDPMRKRRSRGLAGSREGIIFNLSDREIEVLRLISEGFTNREIAHVLHLSPNTVKSHVVGIFNKLGINDRTQAAVWAAQNERV